MRPCTGACANRALWLRITLMHQRPGRPELQVGLGDSTVHDLTFVQLRAAKRAARRGSDRNQLVEGTTRGANRDCKRSRGCNGGPTRRALPPRP